MDIYKVLQNNIQSKIHKNKLYGSDCNLLSQKIYDELNRQVSSSTLKRFFGLIKSKHTPSKYTLDTLAEFVGYRDWKNFQESHKLAEGKNDNAESWDSLRKQMMQLTLNSLDSLKQKTNYNKLKFLFRQKERERFEKFEKTNVPATLFIAPDGYGKSTLMIQLLEQYFLQKNTKFRNDIVCLIDGGMFFNIYSKYSNIDLLNQLIEFHIDSGNNFYFQKHPALRKGRIWLIIDDVDDVFFERKNYYEFIEHIMNIIMVDEGGWFKVLLTCRPENLDAFKRIFLKKPLLRSFWFDVDFSSENYIDNINIPPFSNQEIEKLLNLNHAGTKYKDLFTHYKDVLEIISTPYFFSLFIHEFKQDEDISEIILLNRFIKTKIFSPPLLEEKLLLIKHYVALCKRGKESATVEKNRLLAKKSIIPAYNQLISGGIIYECFFPVDSIDVKIQVSFSQKIIIEYLIFHSWIRNEALSTQLFFEIMEYYKNNQMMQCSMMKFFIKKLMQSQELNLLKQINIKLHEYATPEKGSKTNMSQCMATFMATLNELAENNIKLKSFSNILLKQ